MSELKITQEKVTAAFSEANDCPKAISILTALFGKQKPDYTDYHNIKTYEDACEAIGVKPIVRLLVEDEDGHKEEVADIAHLAYIKLCTIARALNNDPDFPRFTKDEYRYTPWFYLYNQKEIDEMIESGNKKEEYREIKKYWIGRLAKCGGRNSYEKTGFYCKKAICFSCITRGNGFHPKEYTHVRFRFGYTKRTMLFELESITIGVGNTNWGAPDNECVFILKLGKCIKKNESKDSTEFQPKNS